MRWEEVEGDEREKVRTLLRNEEKEDKGQREGEDGGEGRMSN